MFSTLIYDDQHNLVYAVFDHDISPCPSTRSPPLRAFCSLTLSADDASVAVSGTFNVSVSGASNTVVVPFDADAAELEVSNIGDNF